MDNDPCPPPRPTLTDLANQSSEILTDMLRRALGDTDGIPVAAFNSSI